MLRFSNSFNKFGQNLILIIFNKGLKMKLLKIIVWREYRSRSMFLLFKTEFLYIKLYRTYRVNCHFFWRSTTSLKYHISEY